MLCASLTEKPITLCLKNNISRAPVQGNLSGVRRGGEKRIGKGKNRQRLRKELKAYEKAGLQLLLDGQPSSVKAIARACSVKEEGTYMRDYIRDEAEEIIGISFDLIKEEEQ